MRAYGSDRVRRGRGEQWILVTPRSKGWVARTPARNTVTRERPGTAVLWEERYFEVVAEESERSFRTGPSSRLTPGSLAALGMTGVRYTLEPWRDEHVMRVVDAYDESSEARREAEHQAELARARGRRTANVLGLLTGQLPARVQEQLASELGVMPARLTLLSLLVQFSIVAAIVLLAVHRRMENQALPPLWVFAIAFILSLECAIRLNVALAQNRPVGSIAGFVAYSLYYLLAPKGRAVSPLDTPSPDALKVEVSADVELNDAYVLREPFLTLLSPQEQRFLEQRFGFNYQRMAVPVAATILFFSTAGVVTSVYKLANGGGLSPLLALLAAGALGAEQISRLSALRRGPAPSVLAALVRPFSRKLFI